MISYDPQHFSDVFDTDLGARLWTYLNQDKIVSRLKLASDLGLPAVEGVGDELLGDFGGEVQPDRTKQMIGHMVRQILEFHGYTIRSQNNKCAKQRLFVSGSKYEKAESSYPYSGYTIEARPNLLTKDKWDTEFLILKTNGNKLHCRKFVSESENDTRVEAIARCYQLGKKMIDSQLSGNGKIGF